MRSQQQGFTLVELMVTVAVFAIMSLIAYPNMTEWVAQRRVANKAEQMANLFRLARAEAVRTGTTVYICPVDVAATGKPNNYCNTAGPEGYAAFADSNKNNQFDTDIDLPLRTVVLDAQTDKKTLRFLFDNVHADYTPIRGGSELARAAAYMPNGTFLRANYTNSVISTGPVANAMKIVLTDHMESKDKERSRAQVLLIDGSGRLSSCGRSEIQDRNNTKCYFN